jgi:hypothetical protein
LRRNWLRIRSWIGSYRKFAGVKCKKARRSCWYSGPFRDGHLRLGTKSVSGRSNALLRTASLSSPTNSKTTLYSKMFERWIFEPVVAKFFSPTAVSVQRFRSRTPAPPPFSGINCAPHLRERVGWREVAALGMWSTSRQNLCIPIILPANKAQEKGCLASPYISTIIRGPDAFG